MNGWIRIAGAASLLVSLVAGCPQPADTSTTTSMQTTVAGASANTPAAKRAPTRYWVQQDGHLLKLYRLPDDRESAGKWFDLDGAVNWFAGDGLYEFSGELGWQRIEGGEVTLDDVLQTLDVRPAAG